MAAQSGGPVSRRRLSAEYVASSFLSCFSVLCMPLRGSYRRQESTGRCDTPVVGSLSWYGLTIREKEKGEQWMKPCEKGIREKRSSTIACCSFPLPIG